MRGYKDIPERVTLEYSALSAVLMVLVSIGVTTAPDIDVHRKIESVFYKGVGGVRLA
jgi:hypothetical protein